MLLYAADSFYRLLHWTVCESCTAQEENNSELSGCFILFIDAADSQKQASLLNEMEREKEDPDMLQLSFQIFNRQQIFSIKWHELEISHRDLLQKEQVQAQNVFQVAIRREGKMLNKDPIILGEESFHYWSDGHQK